MLWVGEIEERNDIRDVNELFNEENAKRFPAGKLCITFTNELKELYAEQPDAAYQSACEMRKKYLDSEVGTVAGMGKAGGGGGQKG